MISAVQNHTQQKILYMKWSQSGGVMDGRRSVIMSVVFFACIITKGVMYVKWFHWILSEFTDYNKRVHLMEHNGFQSLMNED
jgi:hypothetical protein